MQVRARLDLVGDGQEDELRHEPHRVAGGPVLAGLLVVLLVEACRTSSSNIGAHPVVVEAGMLDRAVTSSGRGSGLRLISGDSELLDQRPQRVGLG